MSGGIHEEHAKQHDVACNATSLGVVDLNGSLRSNLCFFDIEEAIKISQVSIESIGQDLLDVMGRYMDDGIDKHRIRHLSMKPY